MKQITAATLVMMVLTLPALAREESVRKWLIDTIEDQTEEAADDLEQLFSKSSARNVDSAIKAAEKAVRELDRLEEVQGEDSTSKNNCLTLPRIFRRLYARR